MSDVLARDYPAHLAAVRRQFDAALQAAGLEQVAIYAGALHIQFLDDSPYPFKVNPQFKWWLPLTDAHDSFIVYSAGKKPLLLYYQPDDYWHVPPAPPAGYWVDQFDVRILKDADAAKKELPSAAKRAFIGEWRDHFQDWGFTQVNPQTLLNPLHYARAAKTPYELECMRRANVSGVRGHIAAEQAFRAGGSEYDIHNAFVVGSGQSDDQHAYHAIVALNEHAATLHYQHWEIAKPAARHSFLIDAGTQFHGYASDITRTYSAADDEF
ncbi:MAG TPA: M24 family metallopeptidase, partial [Gammaproteobacteria bacterium]|nr:M24 family metallopeptidase [Gammaproteobacteria bacterium]